MVQIYWKSFLLLCILLASFFQVSSVFAIHRDVTVNSGSLNNPIGIGYGRWEGAQSLTIDLSGSPGDIQSAEMYAPEASIWAISDNSGVIVNCCVLGRFFKRHVPARFRLGRTVLR